MKPRTDHGSSCGTQSSMESCSEHTCAHRVNRVLELPKIKKHYVFCFYVVIYIRIAGFGANDVIHLGTWTWAPVCSLHDSILLRVPQELPWSVLRLHIYGKSSQEASQWTLWTLEPSKPPQSSPLEQSFFSFQTRERRGNELAHG